MACYLPRSIPVTTTVSNREISPWLVKGGSLGFYTGRRWTHWVLQKLGSTGCVSGDDPLPSTSWALGPRSRSGCPGVCKSPMGMDWFQQRYVGSPLAFSPVKPDSKQTGGRKKKQRDRQTDRRTDGRQTDDRRTGGDKERQTGRQTQSER